MGTMIELGAADGHRFAAYVAAPQGKPRGGLVVVQEIFGVNSHIRGVADGYAADGYLAVAPALFDRVKPGYETGYTPDEIAAARAVMGTVSIEDALVDVAAAIAHAASAGKVGIVGYCWGGSVTWLAATRLQGLACASPFYGGRIPEFAAEKPRCPTMCHFGEKDTTPAPEQARAVAAHPGVTVHMYPAGHGFNCDERGSFDPESAKLARSRVLEFLGKHVG